jgi:integrase
VADKLLEALASAATPVQLAGAIRAADRVLAGGVALVPGRGATFADVADRWVTGDLARAFPDHVRPLRRTVGVRSMLDLYVLPIVGPVPIAKFTLDDALRVSAALPSQLEPGYRRVILSTLSRVVTLAVFPLRLLAANPIPKNFRPKDRKVVRPFLYPSEDAVLLGCPGVPVAWRFAYGVLAREGMRFSEAGALDLGDVDLEHGAVTLGANKTDDPRTWALGADVVRALRLWIAYREKNLGRKLRPEEPLLVGTTGKRFYRPRADKLREHLLVAGLTRADLHADTDTRRRMRVHDLRASFVTLALAMGKSEAWVADRTGHRSSEMINRYRRAARYAAELGLGWYQPLDTLIPEIIPGARKRQPKGGLGTPRARIYVENVVAGSFSTKPASTEQGSKSTGKEGTEVAGSASHPSSDDDSSAVSRRDLAVAALHRAITSSDGEAAHAALATILEDQAAPPKQRAASPRWRR